MTFQKSHAYKKARTVGLSFLVNFSVLIRFGKLMKQLDLLKLIAVQTVIGRQPCW